MKSLGTILLDGILIPLGTICNGYALTKLWGWFVVPTFGLPRLSIAAACGLSLIATHLTHQQGYCKDERSTAQKRLDLICFTVITPFMVIFIGWIINHWMIN